MITKFEQETLQISTFTSTTPVLDVDFTEESSHPTIEDISHVISWFLINKGHAVRTHRYFSNGLFPCASLKSFSAGRIRWEQYAQYAQIVTEFNGMPVFIVIDTKGTSGDVCKEYYCNRKLCLTFTGYNDFLNWYKN